MSTAGEQCANLQFHSWNPEIAHKISHWSAKCGKISWLKYQATIFLHDAFSIDIVCWPSSLSVCQLPGRLEFNPRSSHTKDFKIWYLMPSCLIFSIIRYGSRVKWSNPAKGVAPFPTLLCSSYWKGSLRVTLDYGRQLLWLVVFIYLYIISY